MMFLERLISDGMSNNPYWYNNSYNAFAMNDLWLPNCTCYSAGRVTEIASRNIKGEIPKGNAKTWYDASRWIGSKVAKVGAIACFGGSTYGHVAVVERVYDDGRVLISQSNFNRGTQAQRNANYFVLTETYCEVGKIAKGVGLTFQGFLINPYVDDYRKTRNKEKYQAEVKAERVRARKSPNGEIHKGLFIPMGIYNIWNEQGEWLQIADDVWFAKGDWTTLYPIEKDDKEVKELNNKIQVLNGEITVLKSQLKDKEIEAKELNSNIDSLNKKIKDGIEVLSK